MMCGETLEFTVSFFTGNVQIVIKENKAGGLSGGEITQIRVNRSFIYSMRQKVTHFTCVKGGFSWKVMSLKPCLELTGQLRLPIL